MQKYLPVALLFLVIGFIIFYFVSASTEVVKPNPVPKETKLEEIRKEVNPTLEITENESMSKSKKLSKPEMQIDVNKAYTATLTTSEGEIIVDLYAKETPITVNNFVYLAKEGFYDGTIFHRVIKDFMIQGGDPTGTGAGGPGYQFDDEPFSGEYVPGTIAMANAGPDTNGSQFFIMHGEAALPPNYVIFGNVSSGQAIVDAIATAQTKVNPMSGEKSVPLSPVVVEKVTINEN